MVDVWSDDVGQPDGHGRMVYRRLVGVGWSDRQFAGLMGGWTDCRVTDGVAGGWTDRLYDGQAGMMDGLAVGQTDSATELRGDRQTGQVGGRMDGLVAQQTDVEKDRWVGRQMYR